ncbi:uncharacterized protein Mos isoform X2 [Eurosta solidaginis]|uniref:uncharacterized protein Mos isoform X2 n=1 Tax=Eurosta solidaginis TaxID=178769 RepID=UPI003531293F
MALLQLPPNNEQAIVLNTPNRNELLRDGLPTHTKYTILGRGAFGIVFKAIYRGQSVAVKIVRNLSNTNAQSLRSEMRILGWNHPNIIKIFRVETTPNFGIVIMERIMGPSLQEILEVTPLPLIHRIFITQDILSALSHCHSRNLLHLDVKPQNILIYFVGAQLNSLHADSSTKGNARGTMRYMSPEALREEPLTPHADIYSLGITMWQMKHRRTPYHWIACNEVVAYQVVKNKLRPDSTAHVNAIPKGANTCKAAVRPAALLQHHNCHCANLTADEITYHSLVHLTNVINRSKKPEEQLRFSDCGGMDEPHQRAEQRRPFASLTAKMNVMRNLSGELNCNTTKSPQALQGSPMQQQKVSQMEVKGQKQQHIKVDIGNLLALFQRRQLHDLEKEQRFEMICRKCWSDYPSIRPSARSLQVQIFQLLVMSVGS